MSTTSSYSFQPVRPEFTANSFTPNSQMMADAHRLKSGWVVAYNNHDINDGYILLDFYDANSHRINTSAIAPYNTIANTSASGAPSVTQLENGKVLVVWNNQDPANLGLKAALFTATGEKIGTEKMLVPGHVTDAHIESLNQADGFLLTYVSQNHVHAIGYSDGVNGPYYTLPIVDLAPGATVSNPTSTVLANGGFVIAWNSYQPGIAGIQLHARIYNNDAGAVTGEFTIDAIGNNVAPSMTALHNGFWAIAYGDTSWADENGSAGVSLLILSPHGTSMGPKIHVNAPSPQVDSAASVSQLDNGFILVSWHKEVSPNSFDIYGRVFTQSGDPVTINGNPGEFLISSSSGNDTYPDMAALQSGQFVTAWTSTDNGGQEIAATVKELVRTTTGNDANDTITGDALRDVISSGGGQDGINAGAGNDVVDAGSGNDGVTGGLGDDLIDGGSGDDTAYFSMSLDHYTINEFGAQYLFVKGADGTDRLTNIEHLRFTDGRIDLADDGNPLFDTPYYLSQNLDVFHAGVNALEHFNATGWHEGRNPNRFFDTSDYLAVNKDVAASGVNPLDHYHQTGWHEGRDPTADFDTTLYLINNPDVAAAGSDPFAHYLQFGLNEGRHAYTAIGQHIVGGFDAEYYLWHNPDVAAAGVDPLQHFNTAGWHEGRNPNGAFDTAGYLAHYADVAAAGVNPLDHYMTSGWQEGRDPSARFDTQDYLAANPDVAAAHVNPLDHYLQHGIYEGRMAFNDGTWG